MFAITHKFKEVALAVLPITLIVMILNFTVTPLGVPLVLRFLIGALLIIIGLSIFLFGVDLGITPIGSLMGTVTTKSNKIVLVIISGIILGFFISVAEPDLHILANQVATVTAGIISKLSIVVIVSIGIAVMLSIGLIRIIYNYPLYKLMTGIYLIIFALSIITSREFLAISFDASGATTGALTVPFILALGLGVAKLKKDSKASEKDSFGLVGVASTGAIMALMIMNITTGTDEISGSLDISLVSSPYILKPFLHHLPHISMEIAIALLPLLILYLAVHIKHEKFDKRAFKKILKGLIYTFIGLVLFLVGVNGSFMDVGIAVGYKLASFENKTLLVIVGFILGLVTILAEPAVYVLTRQIETVTNGYVRRRDITLALSLGVGISVALSMIRIIIPEIQLWHYLLPGYAISIGLMYIVPKLFIGMAFDSGGVASGPMTATFVLAFAQGAAEKIEHANILVDGFGMIAMVALTPIITLQILGLLYKIKSLKGGI